MYCKKCKQYSFGDDVKKERKIFSNHLYIIKTCPKCGYRQSEDFGDLP